MVAFGKWWDDGDTIRLYHGTSSRLAEEIRRSGLQPPPLDLRAYALEILEAYLPRSVWTDALVEEVVDHAIEHRARFKALDPRVTADLIASRGSVVYASNDFAMASSYARSNARHGGEIAENVWQSVVMFLCPDVGRQRADWETVLTPRWSDADPLVVEFEMLKTEVMIPGAELGETLTKHRKSFERFWNSEQGKLYRAEYDSFGAFVDDEQGGFEFRIPRIVHPEQIRCLHEVGSHSVAPMLLDQPF